MLGICKVSVAPIRAENNDQSEMITQILYGETADILQREANWVKVKMHYDGYEGWMDAKQLTSVEAEFLKQRSVHFLSQAFLQVDLNAGNFLLSAGSEVEFKTPALAVQPETRGNVVDLAQKFINVPYLWGGRSFFGIDCSGFTQIIYKVNGIKIPRDASQQALRGKDVSFVDEALPGDLAFFCKFKNTKSEEEGEKECNITHVGIVLKNSEIIHAHGSVRIDRLDSTGIYNVEQKQHTHQLRFIKNFID